MTGRHLTTTSPSSSNSKRSTPWVDGCCAPMLTVSSSRFSLRGLIAAIDPPRDGEVDGLGAERLGAPQGVALPIIWQHDSSQIGVAVELDAQQVDQLALVPVGAGDDRGQAVRLAVGARLEPEAGVLI